MSNPMGLNAPAPLVLTAAAVEDLLAAADPELGVEVVIEAEDGLSLNVGTGLANDFVVTGVPVTLTVLDASVTELSVTVDDAISGP